VVIITVLLLLLLFFCRCCSIVVVGVLFCCYFCSIVVSVIFLTVLLWFCCILLLLLQYCCFYYYSVVVVVVVVVRFLGNSDLNCSIMALTGELKYIYRLPGSGLRPTTDNLIAPWASIDASWMNSPGEERQQCPEPDPGNLVLSPAPGEQFDISILLADQLLNYVSETIFMQVEGMGGSTVAALLQLNGLQFGVSER